MGKPLILSGASILRARIADGPCRTVLRRAVARVESLLALDAGAVAIRVLPAAVSVVAPRAASGPSADAPAADHRRPGAAGAAAFRHGRRSLPDWHPVRTAGRQARSRPQYARRWRRDRVGRYASAGVRGSFGSGVLPRYTVPRYQEYTAPEGCGCRPPRRPDHDQAGNPECLGRGCRCEPHVHESCQPALGPLAPLTSGLLRHKPALCSDLFTPQHAEHRCPGPSPLDRFRLRAQADLVGEIYAFPPVPMATRHAADREGQAGHLQAIMSADQSASFGGCARLPMGVAWVPSDLSQ